MKRLSLILSVCLLSLSPIAEGNEPSYSGSSKFRIAERIESFINEMKIFSGNLASAQGGQLKSMERLSRIMDAQWMEFYMKESDNIVADEHLLGLATDYEQLRDNARDSLEVYTLRMEKTSEFVKAEKSIVSQARKYDQMKEQAVKLSFVKQAAKQLEKLKAEEQLVFSDITQAYEKAKEAADANPALKERMAVLTDEYLNVSIVSQEIQQAEFKPFVQRIKDYLMSFAAVSIIMMFFVFIGNYIKTFKTVRESEKKMKEMLKEHDGTTPTI